jgi:hypothetical protein
MGSLFSLLTATLGVTKNPPAEIFQIDLPWLDNSGQ